MLRISIFFIVLLWSVAGFSQSDDSVLNTAKDGIYKGSASGVLFIKNPKNQEVILDFQGSSAVVEVIGGEEEEEHPYGNRKEYKTTTTSGKTALKYSTVAYANELKITLAGEEYFINTIDGACDIQISGLDFYFKKEEETEYLILTAKKELVLQNEERKKTIKVLPKSVMIWAVEYKTKTKSPTLTK